MKIFFAKNFDKNLDTGINFEMSKENNTTDNLRSQGKAPQI